MNDQQAAQKMGLEEYMILVPFSISVLLTLLAFALKPFASEMSGLMTKLSYYAYAWLCCISVSQCVRRSRHLRISLFEARFPASVNGALNIVSEVAGFAVVLGVFTGSFLLLTRALNAEATEPGTPIPLALGYFAPVIGYGLALVRYIEKAVRKGRER